MKSLSKLTFVLLLCLTTAVSFSQTATAPKQKIFANFPNTIHCSVTEFSNAFTAVEGQRIILSFSDDFKFSGTVITNMIKYANLQTMTIRSSDIDNTIFQLSKQLNTDNSVSFVGRIINAGASDGYEIKRDLTGNYNFEKLDAEKVLVECNL